MFVYKLAAVNRFISVYRPETNIVIIDVFSGNIKFSLHKFASLSCPDSCWIEVKC